MNLFSGEQEVKREQSDVRYDLVDILACFRHLPALHCCPGLNYSQTSEKTVPTLLLIGSECYEQLHQMVAASITEVLNGSGLIWTASASGFSLRFWNYSRVPADPQVGTPSPTTPGCSQTLASGADGIP